MVDKIEQPAAPTTPTTITHTHKVDWSTLVTAGVVALIVILIVTHL